VVCQPEPVKRIGGTSKMAIGSESTDRIIQNASARVQAVERLNDEAELGASAAHVLRALAPMVERRLGTLLDQFSMCPPELGALLDLRAKIAEVWRIQRELIKAKDKGERSYQALQVILQAESRVKGGG
jgi:hypothetical protein